MQQDPSRVGGPTAPAEKGEAEGRGPFQRLKERIVKLGRPQGSDAKPEAPEWIAGRNFGDLFDLEYSLLEKEERSLPEPGDTERPLSEQPNPQNRLWRRGVPKRDLFGLALSGGGIRSATFNLGLLQGLDRLGLLRCLDYVSTVSGGGYIGGFWTAWRHHLHRPEDRPGWQARLEAEKERSPDETPTGLPQLGLFPQGDGDEPWPIRNLREFSNFLSPRPGVLSSDFGRMVVATLAAMVPCLLVTIALMFAVFAAWHFVAADFAAVSPSYDFWDTAALGVRLSTLVLAGVTAGVLFQFERIWRRRERGMARQERGSSNAESREEPDPYGGGAYALGAILAIGSVAYLVPFVRETLLGSGFDLVPSNGWGSLFISLASAASGWVVPMAVYLVVRSVLGRGSDGYEMTRARAAWDRVVGRLLLLTSIWLGLAGIWVATAFLYQQLGMRTIGFTGGFFAGVAWLATAARNRAERLLRTVGAGEGLPSRLRLRLPSLLAYGAVLLLLIGVGLLAVGYVEGGLPDWLLLASLVTLLAALAYLDPNRIGLHAFYRGRIARAFLGAANPYAGYPLRRHTEELWTDDIRLRDLETGGPPLHLVCAAANDLAPVDPLRNLGRGARSAVFSPVGYQVHNEWRVWQKGDELHFSSVLTASGAAINPMMGRFSQALGRGVTFLMASLGLRLGLWLKHPTFEMSSGDRLRGDLKGDSSKLPRARPSMLRSFSEWRRARWRSARSLARRIYPLLRESRGNRLVQSLMSFFPVLPIPASANGWAFPGRLHLRELFGSSDAEAGNLNISDGGHFENLALYELIRRHCRYVIASDCGADPKTAFGDLANLIRRVRQDFGVEVQIDLSPLEPSDRGFARQRVVAGDILYPDGDVGVLLVFKPALLGDEPGDILQYRRSDAAFPQQATYDQFYDEAQWESYRRLGEFAAHRAFGFLELTGPRVGSGDDRTAERARAARIFAEARFQWLPRPPDIMERHAKAAAQVVRLESILHEESKCLLKQVFKEISEVERGRVPTNGAAAVGDESPELEDRWPTELLALGEDDAAQALRLLRQALQVMEESFHLLDLEHRFSDPVNLGVVNYLARWAGAPLLHLWWPLLKTMQEPGFVRFMERRFGLPSSSGEASGRRVGRIARAQRLGFAGLAWLQLREARGKNGEARLDAKDSRAKKFQFSLDLPYALHRDGNGSKSRFELQAALLTASPPVADLNSPAWFWRDVDLFVPPGLWGVGIGESFVREFSKTREAPCVVAITAESGRRRSREALLYKGAGFAEAVAVVDGEDGGVVRIQSVKGWVTQVVVPTREHEADWNPKQSLWLARDREQG